MLYNTKNTIDAERLMARVQKDIERGEVVDYTRKTKRTLDQNAYMHVLCQALGVDLGCSMEYVKEEIFKKRCNPDIFVIERDVEPLGHIKDIKSSKNITKDEMSLAIDRFKKWATEEGFYLPSSEDKELLMEIQIEYGRIQQYV